MVEAILGFFESAAVWLSILIIVPIVGFVGWRTIKARYKTAGGDEVLVISGKSSGVTAIKGGGKFVSPLHQTNTFPMTAIELSVKGQETPTKNKIQVVIDCTAIVAPDDNDPKLLIKAYEMFYGKMTPAEIKKTLEATLIGQLRAVIGELTPEDLLHKKEELNSRVHDGVKLQMQGFGFALGALNLGEVTDKNDYFSHMATKELEEKRETAANIKAETEQRIAIVQAETSKVSSDAKITAQLVVDGRERDAGIERAENKARRDVAEAKATVAGELERETLNQELAERKGAVRVVEAKQAQLAAVAERDAKLTETETDRQREVIRAQAEKDKAKIQAEAEAEQAQIEAEAKAGVAERNAEGAAKAKKIEAKGIADAKLEEAQAEAKAINLTAEAKAEETRKAGLAAADVERAKGEAEAAAILAKGSAEAEAQKLMAEALAANDGANLRVTLAQIDSETQIRVATAHGEAFASVGEKATFIDLGGNSGGDGSDLLTRVLGNIPGMLTKLNVQSEALRGVPFGSDVAGLVNAIKGNAPAIAEAFGLDPSDVVEAVQALGQPAAEDQDLILVGDTTPEVDEVGDSQ